MYKGKSNKWYKPSSFSKAHKGTGLAATVMRIQSEETEVRLFYQGLDMKLKEYYMNPNLQWSESKCTKYIDYYYSP